MRRNDRAELLAGVADTESRTAKGSERARLVAQRAQIEALRDDERLEDYDEAGARLGIPGPITPTEVEAHGIVRMRRPLELEEPREVP